MDMGRELRVALLRNWSDKALGGPVYGVLDADELAQEGKTTLAIDGGRWCLVTAEDVRIVPGVAISDVMPAGWLDVPA